MAIMLEMNSRKKHKVARVLGKKSVELVAVEQDSYSEFYWNISKMIRDGSDFNNYDHNVELYLEYHLALDEVVEIFTIYSKKQNFQLVLPDSGYRTWYDAAIANLEDYAEDANGSTRGRGQVSLEMRETSTDCNRSSTERRESLRDQPPPRSSLKKNKKWSTTSKYESSERTRTPARKSSNRTGKSPYGYTLTDDSPDNQNDKTDTISISVKQVRPPSNILGLNVGRTPVPNKAGSRPKNKSSKGSSSRATWG
jgi:hypothetical protein